MGCPRQHHHGSRSVNTDMPYVGKTPSKGAYTIIDDLSGSFDGSTTAFTLQTNGTNVTPGTEAAMIISISGVVQYPVTAYTVSGSTITFTSAPAADDTFSGVLLGDVNDVGAPSDGTVTASHLHTSFYTQNSTTLTNVTVAANKNAVLGGPVEISGTLTVESGSTVIIL